MADTRNVDGMVNNVCQSSKFSPLAIEGKNAVLLS